AARSMKGIIGACVLTFMSASVGKRGKRSARDRTRALALGRRGGRPSGETADGDFEAGDALLAGHRRHPARTHRAQEGEQFWAQRLGVTDREVAHRIAAVRLE